MADEATNEAPSEEVSGDALSREIEAFKNDHLAIGLLVTITVLLATLFLWVLTIYPSLRDLIPLRYDVEGNPERIVERSEIFILPGIALIVYVVNLAIGMLARFRFQMPFASYLLWGGTLVVQLLVWIALLNIPTR